MWSGIWPWLLNEANQKALALIGGFIAFLWSAGWAVFTYRYPPVPREKKTSRIVVVDENSCDPGLPGDRLVLRDSAPEPSQTQRWSFLTIVAGKAFKIWAAGIVLATGCTIAWLNYFYQPTTIDNFVVCRGEDPSKCPRNDVFVGCGDPNVWASNACIKYSSVQLSSRDGNQCGYNTWKFSCSRKAPVLK
jgi:hypothetical protein